MKRQIKYVITFCVLAFVCGHLHAQKVNPEKELTIGDKVPDVIFKDVMNYKTKTAKLSDFKGRLTILDFWSTSCTSCIELFPHMQSLKDKFKDRLQIILVNGKTSLWHDNESKINSHLKRLKSRTGLAIQLPVVLNCTALDNYFPWKTIPHEVWINDKAVVIAITGGEEVTGQHIQDILAGKKVDLPFKRDIIFDQNKHSLAELIYGSQPAFNTPVYSSILVKGYFSGLASSGQRFGKEQDASLISGRYINNATLFSLYQNAYPDITNHNLTIIDVHKPELQSELKNISYNHDQLYCYDISFPPCSMNMFQMQKYLQEDLERTFQTTVQKEKRMTPCVIIKSGPEVTGLYTKGGNTEWSVEKINRKKFIRNYKLNDFINEADRFAQLPLIDETGITNNIDMDLPGDFDLYNQDSFINALKEAGFEVSIEEKEMEVAVIRDSQLSKR